MASSGSPDDPEHDDVPHDDILRAVDAISTITNKDGRKLTSADATNIKPHLTTIKNSYLALLEKVKELESIKEAYIKRPPSQNTAEQTIPKQQMSYSSAVSGSITKPRFDPLTTIQVYPKPRAGTEETLMDANATKEYLKRVNLTGKGIRVKNIKTIGRKGVSVICAERGDAEKLCQLLNSEESDTIQAKTPTKRDPTLTFLLKGKDHDLTDLKASIMDDNDSLKESDSFSLVHKYHTKNGNTIIVMQVKPSTYQTLKQHDFHLYVPWTRVTLREQDPVTQCFKCQRFGHKASKCRFTIDGNPSRCVRCSGHHHDEAHECTADLCCANCKEHNVIASKNKWKLVDTKHAANDQNCQARIKAINRARSLINYA